MPWDRSELAVAELHHSADGVRLVNTTVVAGGGRCSVCQPMFGRDGALYFVMDCDAAGEADPDNFWNLHVYSVGDVRRVTSELAEFGEPHWVFGSRRLVEVGAGQLVAVRTDAEGDRLVRIDAVSGGVAPVPAPFVEFSMLSSAAGDGVLMVAASAQREAAVVQLHATNAVTVVKAPAPVLADADVSVAEPLRYPTRDGGFAHAFFYAPTSTRYRGLPGTRPPLLVVVHGGPTARSSAAFNIVRQYWTTLGYAVLDVNHRGSTGYGRAYRQRLRGEWGELDVSDIADAVAQVVRDERVDPEKICIRGSSAGGYTVLRALTVHPGRFRAGASYYGIGSLITLAELTHKFEAHYVDVLIGEVFDPARVAEPTSRYRSRSPLFEMDRIESALIVFQGDEDKVVPVAVAREVVETLERNGVEHEYVEYKAEGHGFRRAETRIDALERETDFFRRALGLDAVSG